MSTGFWCVAAFHRIFVSSVRRFRLRAKSNLASCHSKLRSLSPIEDPTGPIIPCFFLCYSLRSSCCLLSTMTRAQQTISVLLLVSSVRRKPGVACIPPNTQPISLTPFLALPRSLPGSGPPEPDTPDRSHPRGTSQSRNSPACHACRCQAKY